MARNAQLAELYAQARTMKAELVAEEVITIADEPLPEFDDPKLASAWAMRQRGRMDARRFYAGKVNRLRWGDAKEEEKREKLLSEMTDAELEAFIHARQAKALESGPVEQSTRAAIRPNDAQVIDTEELN
jgi:hypothetical protein